MIGKVSEITESAPIKRYIGVGAVYVRGCNPTKEELTDFYGREIEKDPVYVGTVDVNGQQIPQVRLDFLIAYPDVGGDIKTKMSFFLRRQARVSASGKKQLVDKYGRFVWANEEDIKNKTAPVYSTGRSADIDMQSARLAYNGEEALTGFLSALLGIKSPTRYVNGSWVLRDASELEDCEMRLDKIEDYFKGDFSELKKAVSLAPFNKIKVCWGVKTDNDGRQYQDIYTRMVLRGNVSNYSRLSKDINDAQAAGAYKNTEFMTTEFHEYVVEATDLSKPVEVQQDPFTAQEDPFESNTPWKLDL